MFSDGGFLRIFCNYAGGLSAAAEAWMFAKMKDAGKRMAAKDFAQTCFFQGNLASVRRDAPRMILGCEGEEREVLVWMLRQTVSPDCYLAKVLDDLQFDAARFKAIYVGEAAALIGATNGRSLCEERREGIAAILQDDGGALDAEIAAFIETTKSIDAYQILPWLTNRTKLEIQECVRRLRSADLLTLPSAFFEAFPLLEDYLAPYALGDAALEAYFTEYRAQKVANAVPAMARIPTSTKFNPVKWPEARRLNGIPDLDGIIHNGAHPHGVSTDEENFVALLKVFDEIVMPAVAQGLAAHGKVVLTADHGASRLAVLANRTGLAQTLTTKGVDDFKKSCLRPAVAMRTVIRNQLQIMDPKEFGGKNVAAYTVKAKYEKEVAADGR